MSVATIVSIYPKAVNEKKSAHLEPATFDIPACLSKDGVGYPDYGPVTLPVLDGKTKIYRMEGEWIEAPVIAYNLAKSVVYDFTSSCLDVDVSPGSYVGPGLFAIDGSYDRAEKILANGYDAQKASDWVKSEFKEELDRINRAQDRWFQELVRRADNEFSRTRNHRSVSDVHRLAAKRLAIDRDWTKDVILQAIIKCPACRMSVDPLAVICPNCKFTLNPDKLAELQRGQASRQEETISL